MSVIVMEFPLPPSELSPNKERNSHWAAIARHTAKYRDQCGLAIRENWELPHLVFPVTMLVEYYCCREKGAFGSKGRYLPRDVFNVPRSIKALVDGMVDAGILPDDSLQYISEATVRLFYVSERAGEKSIVRITLTSATASAPA